MSEVLSNSFDFKTGVRNIELMSGGTVASVYSFASDGVDYVVRFVTSDHQESIQRATRAIDLVESSGAPFPVPVVITVGDSKLREHTPEDEGGFGGEMCDLSYMIQRRIYGEPLEQIQDPNKVHLVPAAVECMDAIRQVNVSMSTGWGLLDKNGVGQHDSWRESLATVAAESEEFLTAEARRIYRQEDFDYFYGRLKYFWEAMPDSDRSLVHADWGWDNVLIHDDEISGVLDWDGAQYGDPLLDPARNDFYYPEIDFRSRFEDHYLRIGLQVENLNERWSACQLWAMLNDLKWYSVAGWDEPYKWIIARMRFLLGEGPAVGRHP